MRDRSVTAAALARPAQAAPGADATPLRRILRGAGLAALLAAAMAASFPAPPLARAGTPAPPVPAMAEAQEYADAGVSIALPKDYEPVIVTEPFDILRAELREKGRAVMAVSLWAFPVEPKITADLYAEAMLAELSHNSAIRNFKALGRSSMKIAGTTGTLVKISYAFHGGEVAAMRLYVLREAGKARLCYVLNVQGDVDRQGELEPLLSELAKGTRFVPLQRPSAATMKDLQPAAEDARLGLSIRPPRGWYMHLPKGEFATELGAGLTLARTGLQIGQTDLTGGGDASAQATVLLAEVHSGEDDAATCSQRLLKACLPLASRGKAAAEGATTMLGATGVQTVIQTTAASELPKSEDDPPPAFTVIRSVCLSASEKGIRRGYALVLRCRAADAAAAAAMMDRLAAGLAIAGEATTAPSTTRPAR